MPHLPNSVTLHFTPRWANWLAGAGLLLFVPVVAAAAETPAAPIHFGRQVQPILARKCVACHGPDKAEGGLRLHNQEGATKVLDSGALAIVPGKPAESELLRRVTAHDESERMPPEGAPLNDAQIATLKQWIAEGAKWEEHWSFQKLVRPAVPAVKNNAWVKTPIDAFILRELEAHNLQPAPQADRATLIRRVYYDVTGLPPTPEEVRAFVADPSPDAWERLIDKLLASPHYGERWGRHWLDVVRYAETNSFERDGKKPHVWRYRDYVIRSFNEDKPYNQFVREQLAGDEMVPQTPDGIVATGFFHLGLWDDEPADREQALYDGFDDLVATTGQAFLGLTINCARCHDHKLDPITQKEYYGILAYFRNVASLSNGPQRFERPLVKSPEELAAYKQKVRELEERRRAAQEEVLSIENEFRQKYEASQQEAVTVRDLDDLEFRFYRDSWTKLPVFDQLKPETIGKVPSGLLDISLATRPDDFGFVFTGNLLVPQTGKYQFELDSDDGSRLFLNGKQLLEHDGVHGTGDRKVAEVELVAGRVPLRVEYFQGKFGKGLEVAWSGPGVARRSLSGLPADVKARRGNKRELQQLIREEGKEFLGAERYTQYEELKKKLNKLKEERVPIDLALAVTEFSANPPETRLMERGNPHSPGDKVEPMVPRLFGTDQPVIPTPAKDAASSGRRTTLANWITQPDNKLTTRVMANRIWQHHFGRGIVRSSNNFGLVGDPPTHPQLLDWLATELVKQDWRLKPLHKLILMSNVYQQSSRPSPEALAKDPINDYYARFDMRRLSAEEVRDSVLAVTGRLNKELYGPSIYPQLSKEVLLTQSIPGQGWTVSQENQQHRRSVYIHVKRSLVVPLLADYDFADTDSSCPVRFTTTQPGQALGMLNGDFMNEQAVVLANRLRSEAGNDIRAQIARGYELVLERPATPGELDQALQLRERLREKHGLDDVRALNYVCLMLLNLNEFVYLD